MKLEVSYTVVRPSAVRPLLSRLHELRFDGRSGMGIYLRELEASPAYLEGNSRIALARVNGELVGWALVCLTVRCVAKFNVFVQEGYRGFGIGAELIRQLVCVYEEVAEVPPTIAQCYIKFYLKASPDFFRKSKVAGLAALLR